jgi:tetratricopeptide (TPR) repeat protein
LVAVVLAAGTAAAGGTRAPSIWDRALDARASTYEKARREAEQRIVEADKLHVHTPMGKLKLLEALQILQSAHAETAADPWVRLDLGVVQEMLGAYEAAAETLKNALASLPPDAGVTGAYFQLAICYAKLGRPDEEIATYGEYLRRETDPEQRAIALSNRGESEMVKEDLGAAIKDLRASVALHPDNPLAHWSLAVALDRNGDPVGALNEAKTAISYDPHDRQIGGPNVFFVPAYNRYWYEALGALARAQNLVKDDAETSLLWWETAVAKWAEFVAAADQRDPWVPLAKAHRTAAERELAQARRHAQQSRKKPRR